MGIRFKLKKEFKFLTELYSFEICFCGRIYAYDIIKWTNSKIRIEVWFNKSVRIRICDVDSVVFDGVEYTDEFALDSGSDREKIHCAAGWLKNAIADKRIVI